MRDDAGAPVSCTRLERTPLIQQGSPPGGQALSIFPVGAHNDPMVTPRGVGGCAPTTSWPELWNASNPQPRANPPECQSRLTRGILIRGGEARSPNRLRAGQTCSVTPFLHQFTKQGDVANSTIKNNCEIPRHCANTCDF